MCIRDRGTLVRLLRGVVAVSRAMSCTCRALPVVVIQIGPAPVQSALASWIVLVPHRFAAAATHSSVLLHPANASVEAAT
eukprot:7603133-Prorocentrum_lima.AAC.1